MIQFFNTSSQDFNWLNWLFILSYSGLLVILYKAFIILSFMYIVYTNHIFSIYIAWHTFT